MLKFAWAALIVISGFGTAHADSNVGGWQVSAKPDANGACMAVRAYADKEDNDKKNAVVFGVVKVKDAMSLIVSLTYEDWKWDKGEAVTADLLVDGKKVMKESKWEGDKESLVTSFDKADEMIATFGSGKKILLRFGKNEEADFLTPNAGLALGAAQLCLDAK